MILLSLIKKEFLQIMRDYSSIMIAFVLPLMLLLIYMYGVNLDTVKIQMGLLDEDKSLETSELVDSFRQNKYLTLFDYSNKMDMYNDLISSKIRGFIRIPNDFTQKLSKGQDAHIQIVTDGSEVNLSNYALSYPTSIINSWLYNSKFSKYANKPLIEPEVRYWFNQEINSHYFIMPGSLAITMTLIGMLLTTLVIAREWERGTMEALLTTRATKLEMLLGKYIPYFFLGIFSMMFSVFVCVAIFKIPFHGSYFVLFFVCSLFLLTALGFGLLISTNYKDQFLASQTALAIGFMPALMFSGLMYPINSMPTIIQYFTKIIPARYFVSFIQSEFMAGTITQIVLVNSIFLLILGLVLFFVVYQKTQTRLD